MVRPIPRLPVVQGERGADRADALRRQFTGDGQADSAVAAGDEDCAWF